MFVDICDLEYGVVYMVHVHDESEIFSLYSLRKDLADKLNKLLKDGDK